uniref:Protein kinase domain-containing protein n=1 Tax=Angiostrongylus cantonensis TaxID=6313 RepID=A0A158P7C2_ANGCA
LSKFLLHSATLSMIWTRDQKVYKDAFAVTPIYLKPSHDLTDLRDWGLHLSRRFKGLRVWFIMRLCGTEGLRRHVNKVTICDMASYFETLVDQHPNLQIFTSRKFGVFTFHYTEPHLTKEEKNKHTIRFLHFLNESHKIFLTHSQVADTSVIRVSVSYERTTKKIIDQAYALMKFFVEEYKRRKDDPSLLKTQPVIPSLKTQDSTDDNDGELELATPAVLIAKVYDFTRDFIVRFIKLSPEHEACATYEELAQQCASLAGQTMIIILPPTKGVSEKSPINRKSKQSERTRSDASKNTSIAEIASASGSVKQAIPSDDKDKLGPELSKDTSNDVSKGRWDDFAIVSAYRRGSEEVPEISMTSQQFLFYLHRLAGIAIEYHNDPTAFNVTTDCSPGSLYRTMPRFAPENPDSFASICKDLRNKILPAESCPSLHELEYTVVNWVGRAFGLPEEFLFQEDPQNSAGGGSIYGSASDVIFCSLMVSRYWKIKQVKEREKTEKTPKYETVHDIAKNLVVYCSKDAHSAIEKACKVAMVRCRSIDPLQENKWGITGPQLEKHIIKDLESGLIPTHFHCTLGTAATAADDDLASIFPVAEKYGLWIHCDASYSGNAWIDEKYRGNA